jgi:tight adherence protein C
VPTDLVLLLVTGLVFCSGVGLAVFGASALVVQRGELQRRLGLSGHPDEAVVPAAPLVREDPLEKSLQRLLRPGEEQDLSRARAKLRRAGYRGGAAVRLYYIYKWTIAVAGVMAVSLLLPGLLAGVRATISIPIYVLGYLASLFAVDFWIDRRIAWRKEQIENGLPELLDLLLVCLEAGHSLDQGFARVSRETYRSNPTLSEELSVLVAELAAGRPRAEALNALVDRTNVPGIISLTAVIKQADRFGVSIADTLRTYAKEMRDRRFVKAEERANLMPVKLAITMVMLTIYPLLMIVVGPAFIQILRTITKS